MHFFIFMLPSLSWMWFVAELDLRPVSPCIPAHSFFSDFSHYSLWHHWTIAVLIELRISWFIQPDCWHFLTHFLLSGACLSSKERNVSLENCTAAEWSSYEFIFDQDCGVKSEIKAFSSNCSVVLYPIWSVCLITSELCVLNRQVSDHW